VLLSRVQVSWHWKSLVEVDQLWINKCLRLGWMLTFTASQFESGMWKRLYIENILSLKMSSLLVCWHQYFSPILFFLVFLRILFWISRWSWIGGYCLFIFIYSVHSRVIRISISRYIFFDFFIRYLLLIFAFFVYFVVCRWMCGVHLRGRTASAEINRVRDRGRVKKTWYECAKKDLIELSLYREWALLRFTLPS